MDAKQAIEILNNYGEDVIAPYDHRPNVWTARKEIAVLIESQQQYAELGRAAVKMADSDPYCEGKYLGDCCTAKFSENRCLLNKFCRLRAGKGGE